MRCSNLWWCIKNSVTVYLISGLVSQAGLSFLDEGWYFFWARIWCGSVIIIILLLGLDVHILLWTCAWHGWFVQVQHFLAEWQLTLGTASLCIWTVTLWGSCKQSMFHCLDISRQATSRFLLHFVLKAWKDAMYSWRDQVGAYKMEQIPLVCLFF